MDNFTLPTNLPFKPYNCIFLFGRDGQHQVDQSLRKKLLQLNLLRTYAFKPVTANDMSGLKHIKR